MSVDRQVTTCGLPLSMDCLVFNRHLCRIWIPGIVFVLHSAALAVPNIHACTAQAGGKADWWRLREACLLGVGALAERIEEQRQLGSRGGRSRGGGLDAAALLEAILHEDLVGSQVPAFLLGRALWLTSR